MCVYKEKKQTNLKNLNILKIKYIKMYALIFKCYVKIDFFLSYFILKRIGMRTYKLKLSYSIKN